MDNEYAKLKGWAYPHNPTYDPREQREVFKKFFGLEDGNDKFTPNMPKEVLEAIETAKGEPFKTNCDAFWGGITEGYVPYLKQTFEHPDAIYQDELFIHLVKNIDGKIFRYRTENSINSHYFERLYPYQLEKLQKEATRLGNGVKAKTKRQFVQEERARDEGHLKAQQEEAKRNKPPLKSPKTTNSPKA
ncbi:hypothetical protein NHP190003_04380 [Helicobacter sp. NHP19-003]|uniref:Uncharacterized protein n=1 Tax=Helicobacter gastrocanis TaxID=2849641 RepID=A0ABN6I0M9_9HELI|nr:hypothetical protein [Helicobacter sp. NHP19-003]BCZ17156.1 hypothetical protein NHP190003_04380 [Helicobacter sp. NHP19-003]